MNTIRNKIVNKIVNKFVRLLFILLGAGLGFGVYVAIDLLAPQLFPDRGWKLLGWQIGIPVLFGLIFFLLSPSIIKQLSKLIKSVEVELRGKPLSDLLVGTVGLIFGLFIAFLLSRPFADLGIPVPGTAISIILYCILGYLGINLSVGRRQDVITSLRDFGQKRPGSKEKVIFQSIPKILDTSVIIDGRIADICKSGFLEGPLVVPTFVLEELQHIADSADSLKRNRGRRGLDIVHKMQEELDQEVIISEETFPDIVEVDSKLLKLTQKYKGKIVTIDYNLNKVATVQGLVVLNINELTNAVKSMAMPGEDMKVSIVMEGKESGQGVAYLDDGTMVVVENGKKLIGETRDVVVSRVLQTPAGKMIFAKAKIDGEE